MAIVYRNAGAWGAGKGSQLTPTEADGNFYDVASRVDSLETNPKIGTVITGVTQPNQYTGRFTLSDASTVDIELPVSNWRWRGTLAQNTTYAVNDVVFFPFPQTPQRQFSYGHKGLYLVTQDQTLPNNATYDDAFLDTQPLFLYDMWQTPSGRVLQTFGYGTYIGQGGEHEPFYGGIYTLDVEEGAFGYYPFEDQAGFYFRCFGRDPTAFQSRTWVHVFIYATASVAFPTGTRLYFKNDLDFSASVSGSSPGEQLRIGPVPGLNSGDLALRAELDTPLGRFNGGLNNGNYIYTNDLGALVTAVKVADQLWELTIENGTFGGIVNV